MTPYVKLEPLDGTIEWIWRDYYDEETGEAFRSLEAAIVKYNPDTGERGVVHMSIPEAETDNDDALMEIKKGHEAEGLKLLAEDSFTAGVEIFIKNNPLCPLRRGRIRGKR